MTWADAPPIAQRLKFTLVEARSLFSDDEVGHVDYCPPGALYVKQAKTQNGKPSIVFGYWSYTPRVYDNRGNVIGGLETTKEYIPHWSGGKANPANLRVHSAYRYSPPYSKEDEKQYPRGSASEKRLEFRVTAWANCPNTEPKRMEHWRKIKADKYARTTEKPHDYYNYAYEADLGFGIERNDMFVYLKKNRESCQLTIDLVSQKHYTAVKIDMIMDGAAVSQERAIQIAKGVAIMMCNKIWGMNLTVPTPRGGSIGIKDIWLTNKLGASPSEDRHANRVKLGSTIYLAIVHRPPAGENIVRINVWFRPSQEAVAASIARTRTRELKDLYSEPLDPTEIDGDPSAVEYDAKRKAKGIDVRFRTLEDGTSVAYVPIDTNQYNGFVKGPGAWQIEVEMQEVLEKNLNANDEVRQISTAKTNIEVEDNPTISRQYFKLPKKAD